MSLKIELEELKKYFGKDETELKKQLSIIKKKYNARTDKKTIDDFVKKLVTETLEETRNARKEITTKVQLEKVSEIISLSYIAKNYFNKTRGWLHHRINNSIVNGKPAKFTDEELKTLNNALKDVGKIIGSTRVSL